MKKETVIKVLKRYEKSLLALKSISINENALDDADRYDFDSLVFRKAIEELERSNTES